MWGSIRGDGGSVERGVGKCVEVWDELMGAVGEVSDSVWGECGGCGKVCWGVGEVRGNVERLVGVWENIWGNMKRCVGVWKEVRGGVGEVLGKVWKSVLGCGGGEGRGVGKCWRRCKKVC